MDLRLFMAIIIGKIISFFIKFIGGGATAAPGLAALKIDPNLVKKLSQKIKYGSIIVSGTNGKTTTARLISDILSNRFHLIHNRAGSNLLRGIASTMIGESSPFGKLDFNLAIWEVDEATLDAAIENTKPKIIVLLNLFRDQLDRYGEVDTIRIKWQKILSKLPKDMTVVLNSDDPLVSILAKSFKGKVVFFGVNDQYISLPEVSHVADIKHCLICDSPLNYQALLSAHLGHYKCSNCGFKRPNPQIFAQDLRFKPNFSTKLSLTINNQLLTINYNLPGLYNVYNILAAASVASELGIPTSQIKEAIEKFSAAFGRFQQIELNNKKVVIFLIKNPTGANEVLRTLATKQNLNILAILNDRIADGRDVSWIWDTNWEILATKTSQIFVSGTRAWDLATRLKYAGLKLSKNNTYKEVYYSIKQALTQLNNNDTLLILPTYTALLNVQKSLDKLGTKTKWHIQ